MGVTLEFTKRVELSLTAATAGHPLRVQDVLSVNQWGDADHLAKRLYKLSFGVEAGVLKCHRDGDVVLFQ